ncbi:MAG: cell division protein FtsA [Acidobacteria bacterium]|nr:cell division protein FtsA [Acidobacteriota bacterium]
MNPERDVLLSLDCGSTMTRVIVAEVLDFAEQAGALRFLGFGEVPSQGWRKGNIADLDPVASSIQQAVRQAEVTAGISAESAVVGIGGPHIQGLSSRLGWTFSTHRREIVREDVHRLMEIARNIPLPKDRELLHLVPQEFVLDSQEGIRDPIGMQGSHLEAKVRLITNSVSASQNLVKAVNHAGILVETLVLEALAVGEAVSSPEERELGTLVAVCGGSTCEAVAYHRDGLRLSVSIPIGGDHFTSDIAVGLHTPLADAETIKKTFGSISPSGGHEGVSFEVPGVGNHLSRFVSRRALVEILEPRAQELLAYAQKELRRCGMEQSLGGGVILTGGGARLHGMCDLAEQLFGAPTRIGLPPKIQGLPEALDSPEYTTVVGLLLYGHRVRKLRAPRPQPLTSRWKNMLSQKSPESAR